METVTGEKKDKGMETVTGEKKDKGMETVTGEKEDKGPLERTLCKIPECLAMRWTRGG
jgi:hypothetical protein